MTRRIGAHLVLVAVGLVALLWALTISAQPSITCRGVQMLPGDVCARADRPERTQTYEQRLAAINQSRPVVGIAGVAVAGFGGWLAFAEYRREAVRRNARSSG